MIRPENVESAQLSGIEVSIQRDFDFLPRPFNLFGIVASATFTQGKINQYAQGEFIGRYNFPHLSDHSHNLTLYYESEHWGVRLAKTFRDNYITEVGLVPSDEDVRGFLATSFWDFSVFYQLTPQVKLSLEGINLSNERDVQYSDSSQRAYNTTTSGRTFYFGVNYLF